MSQFRPPKSISAVVATPPRISTPRKPSAGAARQTFPPGPGAASSSSPNALQLGVDSPFQSVGLVLFFMYMFSGYANDWATHLFGSKAYISSITVVLLPVAWLISGSTLRGLKHPIGLFWAAFLVWMIVDSPFSVWRTGSLMLLVDYVPKSYIVFFYITSFVTSIRRCRYLLYANIAGAFVLVVTCMAFGSGAGDMDEDRFRIPQSLFFGNANDVAFSLLLGITFFLFLFYQKRVVTKLLGAFGIFAAMFYIAKTGSRGCMVAGGCVVLLCLFWGSSRLKMLLVGGPAILVVLLITPNSALRRLSLIGVNSSDPMQSDLASEAALASQIQRQELVKTSMRLTLMHPVFGVGPNQFAVAVNGEAEKKGKRSNWLGTHNSYLQVSSECGIPALLLYCSVIVLCFQMNYRLYKRTRLYPQLTDVAGMSFCLLASTVVYSVSTFFFHIAYSGALPSIAGFSLALHYAAKNLPDRNQPAPNVA